MKSLSYLQLYIRFMCIGLQAIGSGIVMLPLMEAEFAEKQSLLTKDELSKIFTLAQSMPGLIAVNSGAMIGYRIKGIPGAIIAALGIITPAIAIMTVLAMFYYNFNENILIQKIFCGLNISVLVLILRALRSMSKNYIRNIFSVTIFIGVFIVSFFFSVNPVFCVLISAGLSLVYAYATSRL